MRYRKKPVVVNAFQWFPHLAEPNFLKRAFDAGTIKVVHIEILGRSFIETSNKTKETALKIETLEGPMFAFEGDYVIEGVRGEFYPCKPDIFEETYSVADEEVELVYKHDAPGDTSDGSHTFDELYYHRMMLFAFICNSHKDDAWKSLQHDDGTMYDDYFIVGIDTPEGQFTYHYHIDHWDKFDVMMIDKAPKWDGHTSDDITRLNSLLSRS